MMIFRFFLLLSTVLFSLSVLAAEKLVIVPAETDNIPEEAEKIRTDKKMPGEGLQEEYRGAEGYARFTEEHSGESMREAALEDTPIGQAVRAADQGAYAQPVTDIAHGTEETSGAAADIEGNENTGKQSLLGECRSWFFRH